MRRPAVLLVVLALIWGASFMLIKIADRQLAPATLILARIGSATLLLAVVAPLRLGVERTLAELRAGWRWLVVVGLVTLWPLVTVLDAVRSIPASDDTPRTAEPQRAGG